MLQVSSAFAALIDTKPEALHITLPDGTELPTTAVKSANWRGGSNAGDDITLGSTVANRMTVVLNRATLGAVFLADAELTCSLSIDGVEDRLQIARLSVTDVDGDDDTVTVTASDPMCDAFEAAYALDDAALGFDWEAGVDGETLLRAICAACGVTLGTAGLPAITLRPVGCSGYTYREIVGFLACMWGGFARFDAQGQLQIRWYKQADLPVDANRYYDGQLQKADYDYTVGYIQCYAEPLEETLVAGDVTQAQGIYIQCPWMTQERLEAVWTAIGGFTFRPMPSLQIFGDPRVEPGDLISVTDRDGVAYAVPCMTVSQEFDGGLITTITAAGKSDSHTDQDYEGPVTREIKQTLLAEVAKVGTIVAANAQITNATIGTLNANVANISALLAGSAGVGTLEAIHITGDNAVIDDAIITDAMIKSLAAGKITAGTIYTTLVKIASDKDEHLLIDGSTIQIKDAAGTVRVQIGKDGAGDYNYYLWDADGNLLWNPTGVTEAGLNSGIIKDIAIADDANISPGKIDMVSLAQQLNEDGSITVDSSRVRIDEKTLDVAYKTIVTDLGEANQDVTALTQRTETLETDLTVVQGQIAAKVWQTDIETAVSGIQVGGRNLLLDSNNPSTWSLRSNDSEKYPITTEILTEDRKNFLRVKRTSTSLSPSTFSTYNAISCSKLSAQLVGQEVTLSFAARASHTTSFSAICYFIINNTAHYIIPTGGSRSVGAEWKRYSFTGTLDAEFSNTDIIRVCPYITIIPDGEIDAFYLDICEFKIERGNQPTDWTPAPEDVDAQITTISDKYADLSVTVDGVKSTVGDIQTTLGTKADGSTVETLSKRVSTVEQTAAGFSSTVQKDSVISSINQSAEAVKIRADKIDLVGAVTAEMIDVDDLFSQNITVTGLFDFNNGFYRMYVDSAGNVVLSSTYGIALSAPVPIRIPCGIAVNDAATTAKQFILGGASGIKIDCGSASISYGPAQYSKTISFGIAFGNKPVVLVSQVFDTGNIVVLDADITTTGFTAHSPAVASSGTRTFRWVAIGI